MGKIYKTVTTTDKMKLSIITINFNNAEGLRKTIESVVSQTFTDFEYIIIDGGSTDGSVDIIKQYADKITYWVSEPDKGIYNAMNKGILQAKGEYLNFMNSGDCFYSPTVLTEIFEKYNFTESVVTGNRIEVLWEKTERFSEGIKVLNNGKITLLSLLKDTIHHQCSFIKRELFEKYGLYDESYKIVSDWIFFLKTIGIYGEKINYINEIVAIVDYSGISIIQDKERDTERLRAIDEFVPKSILNDYEFYQDIEMKYQYLHKYIFKYKFTFYIAQFINKTTRLLNKPFKLLKKKI